MDFLPVSVWYGPERSRAPMVTKIHNVKKVRDDIIQIKELGFNSIRFWYDWLAGEPKPNEWDFETIETLLSITDELGLKVLVQVYTDSAPSWVATEYPDSLFVDRSGLKIETQASPGVCSDHPVVQKHISQFLENLAKVVSKHTSFYAWDIWSEPHIVQWSWIDYMKDPWFCYCENTQKKFKEWLKNKYKDIEKLNEAWYRKHRNWDEVVPPRYTSLSTFSDLLDWISFNIEKISKDLEWKVKTIKNVDKRHIVSSHAAISSVYSLPGIGYGSSDDWKLAEKVDVWGTSFYPKHTGSWMPLKPHHMGVALDATRSSADSRGKEFLLGELQTGLGVTGLDFGVPVTDKDLERWAWLAISRKAKGLNYYAWFQMSVGFEVSGFGLTEPDGSINEKAEAAGTVSKIVTEHMDEFLESEPLPAQAAIIYSIDSYKMIAALRGRSADIIRQDMFGMYKAMMKENINVDFIHIDDLLKKDLKKYKIIFAPFLIALSDECGKVIKDYVENGGTLVADGRGPWVNEKGELALKIPGSGLNEVFGCVEISTSNIKEPINLKSDALDITATDYLCFFEPSSANVLLSYNDKAVALENSFGSGKAYIIGTVIGKAYEHTRYEGNIEFLSKIAKQAGVVSPFSVEVTGVSEDDIEARLSTFNNGYFCFVFNHGEKDVDVKLSFKNNDFGNIKKITDLKSKQVVHFSHNNQITSLSLTLDAQETKVLLIEK
ncbi:MAG TPA: beta-galactosidase [Defluviitoga tunisiensis]|nr:beta-galactosidase [Defluviitoga tunisiensis]HPP10485.1 beta-galactosidase [Defluviitoga tunisiensis]